MKTPSALLCPGDRIVTSFPIDGIPVVSGIIAMVEDIGRGDFMALIWAGQHTIGGKSMKAFESAFVNLLAVDVVESGCTFPAIPHELSKLYRRAVLQSVMDTDASEDGLLEANAVKRIAQYENAGMIATLIEKMRTDPKIANCSDDNLRRCLAYLIVRTVREIPSNEAGLKRLFAAAWLGKLDQWVAAVRREERYTK